MKLELESMEYHRDESGSWQAKFTVRDDKDAPVLSFTEFCRGSNRGDQSYGWKQELGAEDALKKLFAKARETLKKAGESI